MALDDFCFEGNPVPGVLVGVMEEKNWSNGVMESTAMEYWSNGVLV
jgi:hypothetical protein